LALALCWFFWGNWIGSAAQTALPASVQKEISANTVNANETAAAPPVKPVRIVGGVGFVPAGKTEEEWRYLTEGGQMLTVSEAAGLSGGTVSEIKTGSTRKLVGSGVVWLPSEPMTDIASMPGGAEVLRKMGEPEP
jgi:hypothetical protein